MASSLRRIAGMNLHYRYVSLATFLDDMQSMGIKAVELWGGAPHFYWEDLSPGDAASLSKELGRRGLELVCYTPEQCLYPVNIASEIPALRSRSIEYFRKNLDLCAALDCGLMLITSGTGYFNRPPGEAWELARDALSELAGYARGAGIRLGLEVLRPDESTLVNNAGTLRRMLDEVDNDAIGAVLDINPMGVNGETVRDYADALGGRLWHVHFIDGTPIGHLAWGDGDRDAAALVRDLAQAGYDGFLTLEITDGRYLSDPGNAVRRSLEALKTAF